MGAIPTINSGYDFIMAGS